MSAEDSFLAEFYHSLPTGQYHQIPLGYCPRASDETLINRIN